MTKEDVKNFLIENKDEIAFTVGLTVTAISTFAAVMFAYGRGYARGVTDVSDDVCRFLGYEKYEELRVGITKMIKSGK